MPEQVIVKIHLGNKQVIYIPMDVYDYSFEDGVLTIYRAPYSANEGVVTIE